MSVGIMEDYKLRDLRSSHTLVHEVRESRIFFVSRHFSFFQKVKMATLKKLRIQYGQIPMQYEIQHCTLRQNENPDPEMVTSRKIK
jgi:hypothetical protein